jgi:hypothetical protein
MTEGKAYGFGMALAGVIILLGIVLLTASCDFPPNVRGKYNHDLAYCKVSNKDYTMSILIARKDGVSSTPANGLVVKLCNEAQKQMAPLSNWSLTK